jgi:hypothetical protein
MPTKEFLGWKIAQTVTALLLTICLAVSSWTVLAVVDLREQLAAGRASRIILEKHSIEMMSELVSIRAAISGLPQEAPPKWFKGQVDESFSRLSVIMSKMSDKLDSNADRLARIETDLKVHLETTKPKP